MIPYNASSARSVLAVTPRLPAGQMASQSVHVPNRAFDPIVPPGPRTEQWLEENGWHPRWANTFREVAEEYSMGKWVRVLVSDYEISIDTAEVITACIMDDFNLQHTSTSSSAV